MPNLHAFQPSILGLSDMPPDADIPNAAFKATNTVPTQSSVRNRKGKKLIAQLPEEDVSGRTRIHSYKSQNESLGGSEQLFLTNDKGLFSGSFVIKNTERRPRNYTEDTALPMIKDVEGDFSDAPSTIHSDGAGNTSIIFIGPSNFHVYRAGRDRVDWSSVKRNGYRTASDGSREEYTIETLGADQFSFIFEYKARLILFGKNSLNAYYKRDTRTGIDNDNPVLRYDQGPLFRKGGSLLFGGSLSMDTGRGPDDFLYFVTTEGEVNLFEIQSIGAAEIKLIGTFQIPKPVGKYAFAQKDGDTLVDTENGMVSLLSTIQSTTQYISTPIQDTWRRLASAYPNGWTMLQQPMYAENLILIFIGNSHVLGYNIQTSAWTYWEMDADSAVLFDDQLYLSDTKGIYRYQGARDEFWNSKLDHRPYQVTWIPRSSTMGSIYDKIATMAKFEYRAKWEQNPSVFSMDINYPDIPIPSGSSPSREIVTQGTDNQLGDFVLGQSRLGEHNAKPLPPSRPTELNQTFTDNYMLDSHGKRLTAGAVFLLESEQDPEIEIISMEIEFNHGASL